MKEDMEKYQQEIKERFAEGKEDLREQFTEGRDTLKESLEAKKAAILTEGKDRIRELRLRLSSPERYILRSFPNMRPTKSSLTVHLEELREEMKKSKENRKVS